MRFLHNFGIVVCQFFVDYHSDVVEKTWHDLWMNIGANQDNQVMRLFDTVDGEILHQLSVVVYPTIYKVLYIPGGCLGFLNHQQYHTSGFKIMRNI